MVGINSATLFINGLCESSQNAGFQTIHKECEYAVKVNIKVLDIQSYKFIGFIVLGVIILLTGILGIYNFRKLVLRKRSLSYN